jgi:hypothetical protein
MLAEYIYKNMSQTDKYVVFTNFVFSLQIMKYPSVIDLTFVLKIPPSILRFVIPDYGHAGRNMFHEILSNRDNSIMIEVRFLS